jgi:hypothetical protein
MGDREERRDEGALEFGHDTPATATARQQTLF